MQHLIAFIGLIVAIHIAMPNSDNYARQAQTELIMKQDFIKRCEGANGSAQVQGEQWMCKHVKSFSEVAKNG